MMTIKRSATVPYSAAQMYELVNDVDAYPEFLPWCKASQVLSRTADEVRATLHVSKAGIEKSFSTCNRLRPNKMIEISLLDGPFKHLHGFWRFQALDLKRCKVSIDLEFELMGGLFDHLFGLVFNQIAQIVCAGVL